MCPGRVGDMGFAMSTTSAVARAPSWLRCIVVGGFTKGLGLEAGLDQFQDNRILIDSFGFEAKLILLA